VRTVCCRICGDFHKKRTIGAKVVFCENCKELVCAVHTEVVKRPDPWSWDKVPKLIDRRFCRICLAEEALTV
jgi:hypothetical protein